jgi:molybdenum cofactor biosynthesis enzyme MoaA
VLLSLVIFFEGTLVLEILDSAYSFRGYGIITLENASATVNNHIFQRALGLDHVLAGIETALELGYDPVKVNCVITKGVNDDELLKFVEFTRHKAVDVRFIEYMPFDGATHSHFCKLNIPCSH